MLSIIGYCVHTKLNPPLSGFFILKKYFFINVVFFCSFFPIYANDCLFASKMAFIFYLIIKKRRFVCYIQLDAKERALTISYFGSFLSKLMGCKHV